MLRNWFWQLEALGQGPDYRFVAQFVPADAPQLAAFVRHHSLPEFVRYLDNSYIDQRNHAQLVANLAGDQPRNLWIYHTIDVRGHELVIERGYGGYPGAHGSTETGLVAALAREPTLTLQQWRVVYSGDSYPEGCAASGTTATQLLTYLHTSTISL